MQFGWGKTHVRQKDDIAKKRLRRKRPSPERTLAGEKVMFIENCLRRTASSSKKRALQKTPARTPKQFFLEATGAQKGPPRKSKKTTEAFKASPETSESNTERAPRRSRNVRRTIPRLKAHMCVFPRRGSLFCPPGGARDHPWALQEPLVRPIARLVSARGRPLGATKRGRANKVHAETPLRGRREPQESP